MLSTTYQVKIKTFAKCLTCWKVKKKKKKKSTAKEMTLFSRTALHRFPPEPIFCLKDRTETLKRTAIHQDTHQDWDFGRNGKTLGAKNPAG